MLRNLDLTGRNQQQGSEYRGGQTVNNGEMEEDLMGGAEACVRDKRNAYRVLIG